MDCGDFLSRQARKFFIGKQPGEELETRKTVWDWLSEDLSLFALEKRNRALTRA
jgi:hypothetical protein